MSDFQWTPELVDELVYEIAGNIGYDKLQAFKDRKQPKQEWEIEFMKKGDSFHRYYPSTCSDGSCSIWSVRRLSDGEVFTVGDSVDIFNCLARHTIIGFEINDRNKMLAKFDDFPSYDIMLLRRKYSNSSSDKPIPVYLTHSEIEKLRTILATH